MNFHRGTTDVSVQLGIVPYVRGHTCKRTHQGRIYMYIRPRYIPTHLFHFKDIPVKLGTIPRLRYRLVNIYVCT